MAERFVISVMVAVSDAPKAVAWYTHALGATALWNLGSVAGLEIAGAPFFVGQPANNGWESPAALGMPSARIEVFCDDPDGFIARAVEAGADGRVDQIRNHQAPWGVHRQGGFVDPFGHIWLVGDRSPLGPFIDMGGVAVFGILRFPPDKMAEVRPHLQTLVEETRRHDGCIAYDVGEDIFTPGLLRFSEVWPDRESLSRHLVAPHLEPWRVVARRCGLIERTFTAYDATGATPT